MRYKGMLILLAFTVFVGFLLFQKAVNVRKEVEAIYSDRYILRNYASSAKLNSYKIIFTGDIMLDRGVETAISEYGGGDYSFPFLKIADYLKRADLTVGNLEGAISDKGYNVGSIYSFRSEPKAIKGLEFAGFDLVSLANNHAFDYTSAALEDTFVRLQKAGIKYAGAGWDKEEALSPKIIELSDGTRVAFLAFSNLGPKTWEAKDDSTGLAWLDRESLEEGISSARREADIIITMFHWGEEYQSFSNDSQKSFARLAVDLGADLVVGHHPHVAQEAERYKSKYIAYSLGNFIFDQSFSEETMEGLILEAFIENKEIKQAVARKIEINEFYQPALAD